MISVGSRDGRKGIGLGFDVTRGMEETELEEGEAFSFQDDDPSIDPDIALSYIDEKIQDVLGHFQKDFEGGVSAENLGAKFGGYGSFLPTYQRSPVWSHPRSPPRAQSFNVPSSSNNFHAEGSRHHTASPSSVEQARSDLEFASNVKVPSAPDSIKRDVCKLLTHSQEAPIQSNPPEQKQLKFRIRLGSDNLRNAEIYSGLGLDVSPSSSLDDSPTESEGYHRVPQAQDESPTSILQMMTSFPVLGGLLSPLSDDLLSLAEMGTFFRGIRSGPLTNDSQDVSNVLGNDPILVKVDQKGLENKKTKLVKKNGYPVLGNGNREIHHGIDVTFKKDSEIDSSVCEELVNNTLKLPILANSYSSGGTDKSAGRACNVSREANKGVLKDKSSSDLMKDESSKPIPAQAIVLAEKPNRKDVSAGKACDDDQMTNFLNDVSVCPEKDGDGEAEKTFDHFKTDSGASKRKKALSAEILDHVKLKSGQEVTSHELDSFKGPGKELSTSGGRKKSKGSQSHDNPAADLSKENVRIDSSLYPKNKKNTHANDNLARSEVEKVKRKKDIGKASDRYKDFFGDMKIEEDDNGVDSSDMQSEEHMESEVVQKCTSESNNVPNNRFGVKKVDRVPKSETSSKVAAPFSGNGQISDAVPAVVAPAVIEENWVCCDKCQKWRLLPSGTNPDDLPEKWLCSMLNWLPGMNRCSFTEDETTKALVALYQVPVPENQNNTHTHGDVTVSATNLVDVRYPSHSHLDHNIHAMPSSGKKKQGLKLSVTNEHDVQHLSRSGNLPLEKHRHKQKEKHKMREHSSLGGEAKKMKMKSRLENDHDSSRVSKKLKTEGMPDTEKGWMSDHVGPIDKMIPSSSSDFPADAALRDCSNHKERASKDVKHEEKNNIHVSVKKPKIEAQVSDDRSVGTVKRESRDVAKKRKEMEVWDNGIHSKSLGVTGHLPHDNRGSVKEGASDNDRGKKKKTRLPKSDIQEPSAKVNGRTDRKGDTVKDQLLGQDLGKTSSRRSLDHKDPLKRDMGSQPSAAATSSSSKVSGSHKAKANTQELKGSPVESVSSSPLRVSNPDKPTSTRRSTFGKDDFRDGGSVAQGSPRRCSDGEDDGRCEHSGVVKKEKTANANNRQSLESVLDFRERGSSYSSGGKVKQKMRVPELTDHDVPLRDGGTLGHDSRYSKAAHASDHIHSELVKSENHCHTNGPRPRKSGKGSSSQSKDSDRSYRSDFENGKIKITDSLNGSQEHADQEKSIEGKNISQEKVGLMSDKLDKVLVEKNSEEIIENSRRESLTKFEEQNGVDVKLDNICSHTAISTPNQKLLDHDDERFSKTFQPGNIDGTDRFSGRGRSLPLYHAGVENETVIHHQQQFSGSRKGPGPDIWSGGASECDDGLPAGKHQKNANSLNGAQHKIFRQSTPNGHTGMDVDARSPVRRESTNQAANSALKEAKNLKHMADRLKNSGSNREGTGLYFEAALKFLHAASLLESSNTDGTKHADVNQSWQLYSSTAKLCEFCAHDYERSKDMAAAALAYKCVEVAYMRVIYSSHTTAVRDRHELLALQMVPPGESPSSSASDVDNLNNPPTVDRVAFAKGISSPQVAGNHVIAARHRPNFLRLLNFAHDVNSAMEASRKSRAAFAAANISLQDAEYREGISSIKRALDFNFQDVEGLLRLVRLAMEAISRG